LNLDPTTIIAIYGAAVSTLLAVIQVYRFRVEQTEKKAKIEVTLTTGFLAQGTATSPAMLFLTAANVGRIPVTLTSIPSLYLPKDEKIILTEADRDVDHFPYELLPGKKCNYWRDIKQLARSLVLFDLVANHLGRFSTFGFVVTWAKPDSRTPCCQDKRNVRGIFLQERYYWNRIISALFIFVILCSLYLIDELRAVSRTICSYSEDGLAGYFEGENCVLRIDVNRFFQAGNSNMRLQSSS
jgi:hypothetical protein